MVLSPWNDPVPLTRAWCIYELYATADTTAMFEVAMSEDDRKEFLEKVKEDVEFELNIMLSTINAQRSECFYESDKTNIFEVVEATVGFNGLNAMVFQQLRLWVVDVAKTAFESETDKIKQLTLQSSLATIYREQGKYSEAEPLYLGEYRSYRIFYYSIHIIYTHHLYSSSRLV